MFSFICYGLLEPLPFLLVSTSSYVQHIVGFRFEIQSESFFSFNSFLLTFLGINVCFQFCHFLFVFKFTIWTVFLLLWVCVYFMIIWKICIFVLTVTLMTISLRSSFSSHYEHWWTWQFPLLSTTSTPKLMALYFFVSISLHLL